QVELTGTEEISVRETEADTKNIASEFLDAKVKQQPEVKELKEHLEEKKIANQQQEPLEADEVSVPQSSTEDFQSETTTESAAQSTEKAHLFEAKAEELPSSVAQVPAAPEELEAEVTIEQDLKPSDQAETALLESGEPQRGEVTSQESAQDLSVPKEDVAKSNKQDELESQVQDTKKQQAHVSATATDEKLESSEPLEEIKVDSIEKASSEIDQNLLAEKNYVTPSIQEMTSSTAEEVAHAFDQEEQNLLAPKEEQTVLDQTRASQPDYRAVSQDTSDVAESQAQLLQEVQEQLATADSVGDSFMAAEVAEKPSTVTVDASALDEHITDSRPEVELHSDIEQPQKDEQLMAGKVETETQLEETETRELEFDMDASVIEDKKDKLETSVPTDIEETETALQPSSPVLKFSDQVDSEANAESLKEFPSETELTEEAQATDVADVTQKPKLESATVPTLTDSRPAADSLCEVTEEISSPTFETSASETCPELKQKNVEVSSAKSVAEEADTSMLPITQKEQPIGEIASLAKSSAQTEVVASANQTVKRGQTEPRIESVAFENAPISEQDDFEFNAEIEAQTNERQTVQDTAKVFLLEDLKKQVVAATNEAKFVAKASGSVQSHHWLKDEHTLLPDGSKYLTSSTEDNIFSLTISDVQPDDAAEYTLMINDSVKVSAALEVQVPPELTLPENFRQDITLRAHTSHVVEIPFKAMPKPTVTWTWKN
uniref:IG domain-containing protein n=1 Tax=Macrostomum lignano TaxID=282301 RepID=A0A1I8JGN3_9PLAT